MWVRAWQRLRADFRDIESPVREFPGSRPVFPVCFGCEGIPPKNPEKRRLYDQVVREHKRAFADYNRRASLCSRLRGLTSWVKIYVKGAYGVPPFDVEEPAGLLARGGLPDKDRNEAVQAVKGYREFDLQCREDIWSDR